MEGATISKQALHAALLAALALSAVSYPVNANVRRSHDRVLTPAAVYKICSHDHSPPGVSRGIVAVRGYYLTLPSFVSFVELGVLVGREMSASQAYQFTIVPEPGEPGTGATRLAAPAEADPEPNVGHRPSASFLSPPGRQQGSLR